MAENLKWDIDAISKSHPNHVRTFTGKLINIKEPEWFDIELEDIIHGLVHTNRWGGHTHTRKTVAEHSIRVARAIFKETGNPKIALFGLFHDAAEAYIGDIPSPLKSLLKNYQKIEEKMLSVIIDRMYPFLEGWQLYNQHLDIIKKFDREDLLKEWDSFETTDSLQLSSQSIKLDFQSEYLRYHFLIMEGK